VCKGQQMLLGKHSKAGEMCGARGREEKDM
jgi:hypothetical protein